MVTVQAFYYQSGLSELTKSIQIIRRGQSLNCRKCTPAIEDRPFPAPSRSFGIPCSRPPRVVQVFPPGSLLTASLRHENYSSQVRQHNYKEVSGELRKCNW